MQFELQFRQKVQDSPQSPISAEEGGSNEDEDDPADTSQASQTNDKARSGSQQAHRNSLNEQAAKLSEVPFDNPYAVRGKSQTLNLFDIDDGFAFSDKGKGIRPAKRTPKFQNKGPMNTQGHDIDEDVSSNSDDEMDDLRSYQSYKSSETPLDRN